MRPERQEEGKLKERPQNTSFEEKEIADLGKIVKVKKMGSGTYGIVYTAQSGPKRRGRPKKGEVIPKIAVKRNMIDRSTDFTGSLKELDMLYRLKGHPHIVNLLAVTFGDPFAGGGGHLSPLRGKSYKDIKDDKVHFIFEHALYDAHSFIHSRQSPPLIHLKIGAVQTLLAIEYMHGKGVIHRDLKPANILIFANEDETPNFKLCDFGLSKPYTQQGPQSPRMVTSWYRAPEICLDWPDYTMKTDIWSIGCILFEMFAARPFLNNIPDRDSDLVNAMLGFLPSPVSKKTLKKMFKIRKVELTPVAHPVRRKSWLEQLDYDQEKIQLFNQSGPGRFAQFIDLLDRLIVFDPDYRYSATEALNHPFFDGFQEYIQIVRETSPPVLNMDQKLVVRDCIERKWVINIIFNLFNNRSSLIWYRDRILFQSLSIFDRYLNWAFENKEEHEFETEDRGRLHTQFEVELRYMVCLYVAIKYFSTLRIPISYDELAIDLYKTKEAYLMAEQFEITLIRDILDFCIYQDTIYEVADDYGEKLDEHKIRDLIMISGYVTSYTGLTARELYQLYREAEDPSENPDFEDFEDFEITTVSKNSGNFKGEETCELDSEKE